MTTQELVAWMAQKSQEFEVAGFGNRLSLLVPASHKATMRAAYEQWPHKGRLIQWAVYQPAWSSAVEEQPIVALPVKFPNHEDEAA